MALVLGACHRSTAAGPTATRLRLVDAAGFRAELERLRGRPVFVNFWASWCEPCIEEFPGLVRAAREWRPRGIGFVSISANEPDDLDAAERTLERFGAPFDSVLAGSGNIDALIRQVDSDWTGALPASFLYGPSGVEIRKELGPVTPQMLAAWFSAILSERR